MPSSPNPPPPNLLEIERRSIDFVPEHERHGRLRHQGPFWFLSNFQFVTIAIGFVGPSLGLSFAYSALAGALGILIGTVFMAAHASQGAEMGLPQMIQSRAQFGYRGVAVALIGDMISLIGFNVMSTVLIAEGAHGLWGIDRTVAGVTVSLIAAVAAIWGHDWLHRLFRALFWISLPLFLILSVGILLGKADGAHPMTAPAPFAWPAFMAQLVTAASLNISAGPYVSDYTRYLPSRTRRWPVIASVFAGGALSAIWLITLGAWLATRMGASDGLAALKAAGDMVRPGLGAALAIVSIAALTGIIAMTAYSAMLITLTGLDSFHPIRPNRALKAIVVLVLTTAWIAIAVSFGGNAVSALNAILVIILYFLIPWTAVNLTDYFCLRRGRYAIADLFTPKGIYGAWGLRGLTAYAVGFFASLPFFVIPNLYTGPLAARLGGVDVGWLVGLIVASGCYLLISQRYDPAREAAAVAASAQALRLPPKT